MGEEFVVGHVSDVGCSETLDLRVNRNKTHKLIMVNEASGIGSERDVFARRNS
jgi:hypothetical protein